MKNACVLGFINLNVGATLLIVKFGHRQSSLDFFYLFFFKVGSTGGS